MLDVMIDDMDDEMIKKCTSNGYKHNDHLIKSTIYTLSNNTTQLFTNMQYKMNIMKLTTD